MNSLLTFGNLPRHVLYRHWFNQTGGGLWSHQFNISGVNWNATILLVLKARRFCVRGNNTHVTWQSYYRFGLNVIVLIDGLGLDSRYVFRNMRQIGMSARDTWINTFPQLFTKLKDHIWPLFKERSNKSTNSCCVTLAALKLHLEFEIQI